MTTKKFSLKKRVLVMSAMLMLGIFSYSEPVDFGIGNDDNPTPTLPLPDKGPVTIPSVDLDGYEITFLSSHDDYTLELRQNGIVVFSTFVSSATNIVFLPTTLQGQYEIRLYGDESYYLYGVISL